MVGRVAYLKNLRGRVDKCRPSVYNTNKFAYANLLNSRQFAMANSKEQNERNGICHRPSLRRYVRGAENSQPCQFTERGGRTSSKRFHAALRGKGLRSYFCARMRNGCSYISATGRGLQSISFRLTLGRSLRGLGMNTVRRRKLWNS